MVQLTSLLATAALAGAVTAAPTPDANPWLNTDRYVPTSYGKLLETTRASFLAKNDTLNAARTRTVQQSVSTFTWIVTRQGLANIDVAIKEARAQKKPNRRMTVGLVLYNLPDRDCAAGESAGELSLDKNGMDIYRNDFVDKYAKLVSEARDLDFAIVLEPDSLANAVTNQAVAGCAKATPFYEQGIAYAVARLQHPNVHLYLDAAHGGWLGWADNLAPTAAVFARVMAAARSLNPRSKIRGFATNVSNYNPFAATARDDYTEGSPSWDESHYASALAPFLANASLPAHFIVDQGRVAKPNARAEWGDWCNVSPAGYGSVPTTETGNEVVDSLVWIKPGGESDGECGLEGAPRAGVWFDEYVQMLVKEAEPALVPTY